MALHERFYEYTKEEIIQIKKDICYKHNCPYLGVVWNNPNKKSGEMDYANKCCNYILYTHQMRGCMPDECKHYHDTNVKKRNRFAEELESKGDNYGR